MGLEIALGAAALGGIAGAVDGATDDPDQVTKRTATQQTTFAPATAQEQELQRQSLENYLKQLEMAQGYEQGVDNAQGYQDLARQQAMAIMSGQGMGLTPQETAQIGALRQSLIDQGSSDVNNMIDQRLQALNASAASRGVRGQALSQLQGDALRTGAQEMGNVTRQANQLAAQQSMQLPYQRLQAQSPYVQGGLSFADQMRVQAQQNRLSAQNPYLLQLLNKERMESGTTTTTGQDVTPGEKGSFGGAMSGFFGGIGGVGKGITDFGKGFNDLRNIKW